MAQHRKSKHFMLSVDKENRRGMCLECGKVEIVRTSKANDRWSCGPAVRARKLRTRYGLKGDLAKIIAKMANSACAICGAKQDPNGRTLSLDHCHVEGTIRGFLCSGCNTGLGYFKDSPDRLRAAAAYLETGSA